MGLKFIYAVVIGTSLTLAACQTQQPKPDEGVDVPSPEQETAQEVVEEPGYEPKPGLTPRDRFKYALKILNKDKVDEALVELETYLLDKPNDSRAKSLVRQITNPVEELYPSESFPVKLKWGQTLSTLSRDYLGDVYGFYGLARFNGIPVSTKLKVGDEIKIPATRKALAVKAKIETQAAESAEEVVEAEPVPVEITEMEEEPVETEVAVVETITENPVTEDTAEAVQITEEPMPEEISEEIVEPEDTAVEDGQDDILLSAIEGDPEEFIRKAVAQESYVVAAATLDELRAKQAISPGLAAESANIYQQAADILESDDPALAARYHFEVGKMLSSKGDLDAALSALKRSVELDSGNSSAQNMLKDTQSELASKYHRLATNAYRKQELDEAISLWEYVLEIDPGHSAAKAYLVQANELKGKLSKIKDQ